MPQFIRFNLFPLHVTVTNSEGEQIFENTATRTFVTDEDVLVYADGAQGPIVAFEDRLEDFTGNASNGWTVLTSEGNTVSISRSSGCGCGSRLKGFNPFPGVPFEGTYT